MRTGHLELTPGFPGYVLEDPIASAGENAVRQLVLGGLEQLHGVVDVPIRREQVLPAIVIQIEQAGTPPAVRQAECIKLAAVAPTAKSDLRSIAKKRERLSGERR